MNFVTLVLLASSTLVFGCPDKSQDVRVNPTEPSVSRPKRHVPWMVDEAYNVRDEEWCVRWQRTIRSGESALAELVASKIIRCQR
ncbi:hypothetical protein COOONC_01663 [Cooperia oncophora]